VFGRSASAPFTPTHVRYRALAAWEQENAKRGEGLPSLEPIGLHELRHSYVSLRHDAGFSLERIGDEVGHSSAYMTDAYRHLIEGHDAEAADRFEDYLDARCQLKADLVMLARLSQPLSPEVSQLAA